MQKRSSENKGSGFKPCYACFQTTFLVKLTAFGSQPLIGITIWAPPSRLRRVRRWIPN
ncbi:hypothetical protein NEISICOT_00377 [Neisseria sicca ATCC 29256]|uniref:Uncharacterized protein n=1 Tax=Neisseria sicca ATCC 29256 TaxID=547045 RepID=C6M1J3_NEISI|nr:hypothetical protein NEISICOT_00377 [Neisseria sicca ATCC 29256]